MHEKGICWRGLVGFVSGVIWMGKVSVKRVMEIDEFCGRGASTKQIGKVFIRGN